MNAKTKNNTPNDNNGNTKPTTLLVSAALLSTIYNDEGDPAIIPSQTNPILTDIIEKSGGDLNQIHFVVMSSKDPGVRSFGSDVDFFQIDGPGNAHTEIYISTQPFVVDVEIFNGPCGVYGLPVMDDYKVMFNLMFQSIPLSALVPSWAADMTDMSTEKLAETVVTLSKALNDRPSEYSTSWPSVILSRPEDPSTFKFQDADYTHHNYVSQTYTEEDEGTTGEEYMTAEACKVWSYNFLFVDVDLETLAAKFQPNYNLPEIQKKASEAASIAAASAVSSSIGQASEFTAKTLGQALAEVAIGSEIDLNQG